MPTFKSKTGREFRLSGVSKKQDGSYDCCIFWFDTQKYETFPYNKIEPYLIYNHS